MPFVNLCGLEVFYEQQGHGDCVLLMLPGSLGTTRLEYQKQFDFFDPNKFTLVSWDAPGFGKSRPPERGYLDCYNRDAKMLVELMTEHVKVEKFNLLGFSDGGRTAVTIASTWPEKVERLILVGTTVFNSPKERKVLELCRNINGWSNDRRAVYDGIYSNEDLQFLWGKWVDENAKLDDFLTSALSKITAPVLLLYGENDIIAPVDPHVGHFRRNIQSRCRTHIFLKTSHYCHQEKANEFNKILEKFLTT